MFVTPIRTNPNDASADERSAKTRGPVADTSWHEAYLEAYRKFRTNAGAAQQGHRHRIRWEGGHRIAELFRLPRLHHARRAPRSPALAEYVRLGRTPIQKDEDGARVLGVAEEPFRVYQQLRLAVEALAVVRGHAEVMAQDVDVVRRLALSSILHRRYEAMRALQQAADHTLTPALAGEAMRLGDDQTRTWLKDLVDVSLLQKDGEGRYVAAPPFAGILRGDGPE